MRPEQSKITTSTPPFKPPIAPAISSFQHIEIIVSRSGISIVFIGRIPEPIFQPSGGSRRLKHTVWQENGFCIIDKILWYPGLPC